EEGRQDRLLHRELHRGGAGGHQSLAEAAAGKLAADVIDHSDRGLMLELQDLFQDYAPPNAADYLPSVLVSPKLWPRATLGWSIAYNSTPRKNPPKAWQVLTKR